MPLHQNHLVVVLTGAQAKEIKKVLDSRKGKKGSKRAEIEVIMGVNPVQGYSVELTYNGEVLGYGLIIEAKRKKAKIGY